MSTPPNTHASDASASRSSLANSTPKSPTHALPGHLPNHGHPAAGRDEAATSNGSATATPHLSSNLPWKMFRSSSGSSGSDVPAKSNALSNSNNHANRTPRPGDSSSHASPAAAAASSNMLDILSLPSLNLNALNPLSLFSAATKSPGPSPMIGASASSSSDSRVSTPRPTADLLGAPFGAEDATPRPEHAPGQFMHDLNRPDEHGSDRAAVPTPSLDRPRISIGTRLQRRPSEASPASPQFRQAASATSLDPITLHALARGTSEGEALRAVSARQLREHQQHLLDTAQAQSLPVAAAPDRVMFVDPPSAYSEAYSPFPSSRHASPRTGNHGHPLSSATHEGKERRASFLIPSQDPDERLSKKPSAASSSSAATATGLPAEHSSSSGPDAASEPTHASLPDMPPTAAAAAAATSAPRRSFLKRLGLSRASVATNETPSSDRQQLHSRSHSAQPARASSDAAMLFKLNSNSSNTSTNVSDKRRASLAGGAPARRRFSGSSWSTDDSAVDPPVSTASSSMTGSSSSNNNNNNNNNHNTQPKTRVHRVKTKAKNKDTREFGHLFLAQELRLEAPSLFPRTTSMENGSSSGQRSPGLESASSADPLSSNHSLPLSAAPSGTSASSSSPRKKPAVWAMEFSKDGKYLAAAGQDNIVRVWQVMSHESRPSADHEEYLAREAAAPASKTSKRSRHCSHSARAEVPVFDPVPIRTLTGHTADVLDLSWSKNNFLLTSSMDKTVRLWHMSRADSLCVFQHTDFVTSVSFHPRDDRYFLSGSLDCRLRLWNVPAQSLHAESELDQLITSVSFTSDGQTAMCGTFSGQVAFFSVDTLSPQGSLEAKSSRGRNQGKKITNLDSIPSSTVGHERLLVTTNDSRLRLYNVKDRSLQTKFSGLENSSSQIRGSFSDDGRFILCGSEDGQIYIWSSGIGRDEAPAGWMSKRKPADGYECFQAESSITTCATMAPSGTKSLLSRGGDPIMNSDGDLRARSRSVTSRKETLSRTGSRVSEIAEIYPQDLPLSGRTREETVNDAIIVAADDSTGVIRIYRNSPYSTNVHTTSRMLRPASLNSNTPSKRGTPASSAMNSPDLG